jgi:hypothetical protein
MALKNKDKLANFTADDFLNDFQKEIIVSNQVEENEKGKATGENADDDEFVFCVIITIKLKSIFAYN